MKKRRADISRNQWEPCSQSFADNLLTPYNNYIMWSPNQILCRMHDGAVESWKVALSWNQILDFLTRWHTLKNLILCYRHHNYITFYCFWYPHLQAKTQAHISKVLLDEWRPPSRFHRPNLQLRDGTFFPFIATHINCLPWDLILGTVHWGRFHLWFQEPFHQHSSDIKQAAHCSRLTSGGMCRCSIWFTDKARLLTGQGQNSPSDS